MKSFMSFLLTLCLSQILFAQTLQPLNNLNELDITATAVQFKNVATGQYAVLKPAPQGGGGGEILVVASKLKNYIRASAGMNTAESVLEALSDIRAQDVAVPAHRLHPDLERTVGHEVDEVVVPSRLMSPPISSEYGWPAWAT